MIDRLALFLAQGLGIGRLHPAPGTWGSLLGIVAFLLLLLPGSLPLFLLALALGILLAVWSSHLAERILGQHDPASVVIDEIIAVPACFLTLVLAHPFHGLPFDLLVFLRTQPTWLIPAVFIAFRLFDIWKPWPIRSLQRLPGGWGVVADDLMAAACVNALSLLLLA